jgi:hypothetical protein
LYHPDVFVWYNKFDQLSVQSLRSDIVSTYSLPTYSSMFVFNIDFDSYEVNAVDYTGFHRVKKKIMVTVPAGDCEHARIVDKTLWIMTVENARFLSKSYNIDLESYIDYLPKDLALICLQYVHDFYWMQSVFKKEEK